MKLSIRVLSYVLILSMLISGISYSAYGQNEDINKSQLSFPDIKGHWGSSVIEKFLAKGWIIGYDDGLFRPDKFVTRAEFTAMVLNIFKEKNR
jgi:hypothetical protein